VADSGHKMSGSTRKAAHAVWEKEEVHGGGGGVIWREERSLCPIQELLAEQHNSKPQQIFKDTGTNQKFPNPGLGQLATES
jgi:hypothetical protein